MAVALAGLLTGFACHSPGSQYRDDQAAEADQIFDERANGRDLLEAALQRAQAEDRHLLLLFGANWCSYCWQLHALLENDPSLRQVVNASFIVVPIDVGTSRRNRNTGLIDRYEASVFTDGTPALVVLDSAGHRVAPTGANPWSARDGIEADRIRAFLERSLR